MFFIYDNSEGISIKDIRNYIERIKMHGLIGIIMMKRDTGIYFEQQDGMALLKSI